MKPFPWLCGTCRQRAVTRVTLPTYCAEMEHDGRLCQVGLSDLEVLRCGLCGAVVLDDEANTKISDALRAEVGLLSPAQIRQQRENCGMSQTELAQALRIPAATLARFENGGQIQPSSVDRLLRVFFNVSAARHFLLTAEAATHLAIP